MRATYNCSVTIPNGPAFQAAGSMECGTYQKYEVELDNTVKEQTVELRLPDKPDKVFLILLATNPPNDKITYQFISGSKKTTAAALDTPCVLLGAAIHALEFVPKKVKIVNGTNDANKKFKVEILAAREPTA